MTLDAVFVIKQYPVSFNSFPNDKILDSSKLKAFADNKSNQM